MKKDRIAQLYHKCKAELYVKEQEHRKLLLGEGNFNAKIAIVGDIPSQKEEEYDQNLLEHHRELLVEGLKPLKIRSEDLYFTYIVKKRLYRKNAQGRLVSRSPEAAEIDFFLEYLYQELAIVDATMVITIGNQAASWFTGGQCKKVEIKEEQQLTVAYGDKKFWVYPMFHPSTAKFRQSASKLRIRDLAQVTSWLSKQEKPTVTPSYSVAFVESKSEKTKAPAAKPERGLETPREQGKEREFVKINADLNQSEQQLQDSLAEAKGEIETKKRVFRKIKLPKSSESDRKKQITIVYGGEGFADDAVLVALQRIGKVLSELGIGIHRIDLYKQELEMEQVFECFQESIGIVLGINVEWFGIGYRLQQFLDQCFFEGEEQYFKNKSLFGVCFSRGAFEREAYNHVLHSWEILGGAEGESLLATIKTGAELETNFNWLRTIDKRTENFYRLINSQPGFLPRSSKLDKAYIELPVAETLAIEGADQGAQSPELASGEKRKSSNQGIIKDYENFLEKQKDDIQEISSLFQKKLNKKKRLVEIPELLNKAYDKTAFAKDGLLKERIQLVIEDDPEENTIVEIDGKGIRSFYGNVAEANVRIVGEREVFMSIFEGKLTMQRAFMTGKVKAKGDFTIIYKFEDYFDFK